MFGKFILNIYQCLCQVCLIKGKKSTIQCIGLLPKTTFQKGLALPANLRSCGNLDTGTAEPKYLVNYLVYIYWNVLIVPGYAI